MMPDIGLCMADRKKFSGEDPLISSVGTRTSNCSKRPWSRWPRRARGTRRPSGTCPPDGCPALRVPSYTS